MGLNALTFWRTATNELHYTVFCNTEAANLVEPRSFLSKYSSPTIIYSRIKFMLSVGISCLYDTHLYLHKHLKHITKLHRFTTFVLWKAIYFYLIHVNLLYVITVIIPKICLHYTYITLSHILLQCAFIAFYLSKRNFPIKTLVSRRHIQFNFYPESYFEEKINWGVKTLAQHLYNYVCRVTVDHDY